MTQTPFRTTSAALATLIVLQGIMLGSLYAGVAPHPPQATPLFGMGPFLGAALSAAVAALVLHPQSGAGRWLALVAAVLAAVSFGPHKYVDAQFPAIWPAVITAQLAIVVICVNALRRQAPTAGQTALSAG